MRVDGSAFGRVEFADVGQTCVVALPGGGGPFGKDFGDPAGEHLLAAQVDDFQIGGHGLGDHADPRRAVVRLGGEALGAGGQRRVAVAAPEVHLVGEVRAKAVGAQPDAIGQPNTERVVEFHAEPQLVQLRADAGIRRRIKRVGAERGLHRRQLRGNGDLGPRPGLLHAGHGLREVQVGFERGIHDSIEDGILETAPPLERLVVAGLLNASELAGQVGDPVRFGCGWCERTSGQEEETRGCKQRLGRNGAGVHSGIVAGHRPRSIERRLTVRR